MIHLRTLVPLDWDVVLTSVAHPKDGGGARGLAVWGFGAEIAAGLTERLWNRLVAPVPRTGASGCPHLVQPVLERYVIPQIEDVLSGGAGGGW